ncbi:hypothetical protein EJ07DRAFT_102957 [Lizonia empirigonia]|nr:hypothetical protein EJ07DRAFT_102957 [Lizonia empirigonia]
MNAGSQSTRPQIVSISIPLDSTQPGTMVFGHEALKNRPSPGLEWIDTLIPGVDVPITDVGIRKGDMVTKDVYTARLALNTPYISLPGEIYDILIQATSPLPWQHHSGYDDVVDCDALGRFPDLVLGLKQEMENEWDDEVEDKEIVITPRQYVLQTEEGKCILLVQRAYQHGTEGVILGWAAVRGRNLVLDWVNERTGFGR